MKLSTILLFTFKLCFLTIVHGQDIIQSPSQFLNYKLGTKFTSHHLVVDYFKYLAQKSDKIKLEKYGETYEGRELFVAFITNEAVLKNLNSIQNNNLKLAGLQSGDGDINQPTIVWLSYNVHGNESVSTEASLKTAFNLVTGKISNNDILSNTIVVIDPCLNPDGRERYVNYYNSTVGKYPNAYPLSREHFEPWPNGRSNHYYFDLNRDWAWQSQIETKQRVALYNKWLPQVHVDFHEQGYNEPYYFAPAAAPLHEVITSWQKEFQTIVGNQNAKYFDQNGWLYFTKERFDLLYPSYGDTYPMYNGSIGMTYEQGGIGAGLSIITKTGDTLTLKDRIEHHYTTGISTIETASKHASKLNAEFKKYFTNAKNSPEGSYKTYVVKAENKSKLLKLANLLSTNGISYGFGLNRQANGYNYFSMKSENFSIEKQDMIINMYQPKSVLLRVLMEPKTTLADSNTYDITAWALPYAFGLKTYALTDNLKSVSNGNSPETAINQSSAIIPYAWVINWNALNSVKFLSKLILNNIRVNYSETPFKVGGKNFNAGSLIINAKQNSSIRNIQDLIVRFANADNIELNAVNSGMVDEGADFGSSNIHLIQKPKVAILSGNKINSLNFGEIWHFFDQELEYPISSINVQDFKRINWSDFNILLLADGDYEALDLDIIQNFVKSGGKVIAIAEALKSFDGKKGFSLKSIDMTSSDSLKTGLYDPIKNYADRERNALSTNIPGSIYKINLDNTHPLGFGFPNFYYSLKLDGTLYEFLPNGWNVGILKKDNYVGGFVGSNLKKKIKDGLVFGVDEIGKGEIIYLADDPIFRSFWENGKLLLSNAIFMVGQ